MKTLGIETSCDETAIAIYDSKDGIIGESVHSQMDMHAEYGGVAVSYTHLTLPTICSV